MYMLRSYKIRTSKISYHVYIQGTDQSDICISSLLKNQNILQEIYIDLRQAHTYKIFMGMIKMLGKPSLLLHFCLQTSIYQIQCNTLEPSRTWQ